MPAHARVVTYVSAPKDRFNHHANFIREDDQAPLRLWLGEDEALAGRWIFAEGDGAFQDPEVDENEPLDALNGDVPDEYRRQVDGPLPSPH